MKKTATQAERQMLLGLIKKGKVKWAGDPKLFSKKGLTKTSDEILKNPDFAEIKLDSAWKRWRRGRHGNNGGFVIAWGVQGIGFGEITFYLDKKNALRIQSERMSARFVKKALAALVERATLDE